MQVYTQSKHAKHSNPKQQHMKQKNIPFHTAEVVASNTKDIEVFTINTNLAASY